LTERIRAHIVGWDAIPDHRTGTLGDQRTAQWLAERVRAAGAVAELETFPFQRRVPGDCHVSDGTHRAEGVPLFDGGETGPEGIRGALGRLAVGDGSPAHPIVVAPFAPTPSHPASRALEAARRSGRYRAIVAVAAGDGVAPGLALLNADSYGAPYGPPVLQVATAHAGWLERAAAEGRAVTLAAPMTVETVPAHNVLARIEGIRPELAPLVVMTPRSAWWTCTSERAGGIAVWLEALRRLTATAPARPVLFTANTGHELGHVGLEHFLERRPGLVQGAHAWVHLGANFAARGGQVLYQASDDSLLRLGLDALAAHDTAPDAVTPLGQRPLGEARDVYDGGGRYVSLLGSNPLFHHPADRWPQAVDLAKTERLTRAMVTAIARLARA
jgi:hypothetical protein